MSAPEDAALVPQLTKASLSEALGTVLYPIAREITQLEERGIRGLKSYVQTRRQQKLADASSVDLEALRDRVVSGAPHTTAVEQLIQAFESAGNQDLDDDSILSLWQTLIARIKDGDADVQLLQDKLQTLTAGEAHLLLEIGHGKRIRYGIHPVVRTLSRGGPRRYYQAQREEKLARLLHSKELIEQRLPLNRLIILLLGFIPLLVMTSIGSPAIGGTLSPLVWPAVAIGTLIGVVTSLSILPPPIHLTWIGVKLVAGAREISMRKRDPLHVVPPDRPASPRGG